MHRAMRLSCGVLTLLFAACQHKDPLDNSSSDAAVAVADAGPSSSFDAGSFDAGTLDGGTFDAGSVLRVLFLGNSYTHVNDLPGMLRRIAETSGVGPTIDFEMIAPGGETLSGHWVNPEVHAKLAQRNWSHVVLQGQSAEPNHEPSSGFQQAAALLARAIVNAGAVPTWFVTWAQGGSFDYQFSQDALTFAYNEAAARWPTSLRSCVGEAFRRGRALHPELMLIDTDGSHPSIEGTYLAASTFYVALTGHAVPAASEVPSEISPSRAALLRELALVGAQCADIRIQAKLAISSEDNRAFSTGYDYRGDDYRFDYGPFGFEVATRFILRNTGFEPTRLEVTQGPSGPFRWSSGVWPGLAGVGPDGVRPCSDWLEAQSSCAVSLSFTGSTTGESTISLNVPGGYKKVTKLMVLGTVAEGPYLVVRRLGEPTVAEATAPIVVETAVDSTVPLDLLLTNRGSVASPFYGGNLMRPFAWGPLNAGIDFPGGQGEVTISGQSLMYCGATLRPAETCLLTANYTPFRVTTAPPGQFTDVARVSVTYPTQGTQSYAGRTLYGRAFDGGGDFDAGVPRCPTTMLFRNGHCYDFVTEPIVSARTARLHSMALGSDGGVHVLFYDEATATQRYTHRTTAGWSTSITVSAAGSYSSSDLAFDPQGVPVAVFEAPSNLRYGIAWARFDPAASSPALGWVGQASTSDSFGTPSVAFDVTGTMHVAYEDGFDHHVLYGKGEPNDPASLFSQAIVSGATRANSTSAVAISPSGAPSIVFTLTEGSGGSSSSRAYLATLTGDTFASVPISAANENVSEECLDLALDAEGRPHVVYFDRASAQLRLAVLSDGGWVTTLLSTTATPHAACSLVMTSTGPHLSWPQQLFAPFRYGWLEGASAKSIEPSKECSSKGTELAIDSENLPHFTCVSSNPTSPADTLLSVRPRQLW